MPVTYANGRPNVNHDMQHPPAPHSAHSTNAIHVELIIEHILAHSFSDTLGDHSAANVFSLQNIVQHMTLHTCTYKFN